ncbi:hypothetical protein P3580_24715, partial [Vibrio parahaemolyticus]|nr:hypothetical protein [Vibrio parahaemolyticus]
YFYALLVQNEYQAQTKSIKSALFGNHDFRKSRFATPTSWERLRLFLIFIFLIFHKKEQKRI